MPRIAAHVRGNRVDDLVAREAERNPDPDHLRQYRRRLMRLSLDELRSMLKQKPTFARSPRR